MIQFYQNRLNDAWSKSFKEKIKNYTNARSVVFTIPRRSWPRNARRGAGSIRAVISRSRLMLKKTSQSSNINIHISSFGRKVK